MATDIVSKLKSRIDGEATRRLLLALVIAAVGGGVFTWFHLPLAWMLGAMTATMTASMVGADIAVPQAVRQPMIGLVGVILGSTFTSDRVHDLVTWLPSVAALPLYVLALGGVILLYLRKVSTFDHKTAFFAATPGGLSEMVILSDQLGGDLRNVALFHSARLVLIVFTIPSLAGLLTTIDPNTALAAGDHAIRAYDIIGAILLMAAGWAIARPLRLPAASFMGPLLASSILHLTGLLSLSPPGFLLSAAQLVIGATIGARFSGVPLNLIARTLFIGGGGALIMFALTAIFAVILYEVTGFPLTLLLLALIPGGFPEMSLIALGMGMDPAFVVTHHGVRVLLVVTFALPIFLLLRKTGWFARHWGAGGAGPNG